MRRRCWLLFDEIEWEAFALPGSYLIGGCAALGEVGMVVALYYGLRRGEATVVVPSFYISMTLLASLQGLLLFDMLGCFNAATGACFGTGVLLACVATALMAGARRPQNDSAERVTPLMDAPMPDASTPPAAFMG